MDGGNNTEVVEVFLVNCLVNHQPDKRTDIFSSDRNTPIHDYLIL